MRICQMNQRTAFAYGIYPWSESGGQNHQEHPTESRPADAKSEAEKVDNGMDPDGEMSQIHDPTYYANGALAKTSRFDRKKRGIKHAGGSKNGLQLKQSRKDRIKR